MKLNEKHLILLVDDMPVNLLILEELLKKEGYEIITAIDGKETFSRLEQHLPDLILLDVMLPDQSGFEICKILKADDRVKEIPVIFLTAKVEVEDKLEGFKAGAVDYITKPFNSVEILARVRTHIRLKEAGDFIREYNEQLEAMLERRTKKLVKAERQAAIAQLIQGIVHNMRNPITNIMGGVGMLELKKEQLMNCFSASPANPNPLQEAWKYIDLINRSAEKLNIMVNNMMIRGKQDKSEGIKRIDLNDIIRQELSFYEVDLQNRRKVKKLNDLWPEPLYIEADPSEVAQVFNNLVKNAVDAVYGQEHMLLEIHSGITEDSVWFSVTDNGPGIPKEIAGHIFEPFFSTKSADKKQSENDKYETSGSGLGLHYCRETVNAYGGSIGMDSEGGTGTTFTVHFPSLEPKLSI